MEETSNFIIFLEKGYRVPYPLISRYFLPLSLFSCPLCAEAHNSAQPRPSGVFPFHALLKSVGLRVYPCPCTTPRRTCPLRSSPRCTRLRCSLLRLRSSPLFQGLRCSLSDLPGTCTGGVLRTTSVALATWSGLSPCLQIKPASKLPASSVRLGLCEKKAKGSAGL